MWLINFVNIIIKRHKQSIIIIIMINVASIIIHNYIIIGISLCAQQLLLLTHYIQVLNFVNNLRESSFQYQRKTSMQLPGSMLARESTLG